MEEAAAGLKWPLDSLTRSDTLRTFPRLPSYQLCIFIALLDAQSLSSPWPSDFRHLGLEVSTSVHGCRFPERIFNVRQRVPSAKAQVAVLPKNLGLPFSSRRDWPAQAKTHGA